MKRMRIIVAILVLLVLPVEAAQDTILTAQRTTGIIELDGHPIEDEWGKANELILTVQDGSIGKIDLTLKALYDLDYLYILATWPDPTESIAKDLWTYEGGDNWSISGDEDRIAFSWNIDNSISGFNIAGCAMLCHGDRMHTNAPNERADIWHWKSARSNPMGFADDEWLDNTVIGLYTESAREAALHHDGSLTVTNGDNIYTQNINADGTGPRYYETRPLDDLDNIFMLQSEFENGEIIEIIDNNRFSVGDTIPGYILMQPGQNRNDIDAKGRWNNDQWQVEFRRKLTTDFESDIQFDIGKNYRFGIAVMDNTGGFEAFGMGHSFDLGARTLTFGGITSEEVTRLELIKDYLRVAEAHSSKGEIERAVSNVGDALILYNEIGNEIAGVDPDLYLSTKNQFMEINRVPSIEGIISLNERIDSTILTFQGKRAPSEATFRVRLLVFWGKIQLFALILLALLSLAPIYKAIQIGRKPTFRRLSVFILVIVIPLLFEGVGRLGILFKVNTLQNFSFLTNELATLQWALLMFFGLFIAKSGFEEVEESMKSLEFYSAKLEDDIDQMKKLQTELRSSEERFRSIFESSPIGILEVKPDGSIIGCNDAASIILDCPEGKCNCKSFLNFIKDVEVRKEISDLIKSGGAIKDKSINFMGPDDRELIISLSMDSLRDEKGKPARSEIAIMDITERITAEEERGFLEKKLAQSERLASVGKLAMGFAHEISNPLTNIQLAAEILAKKGGKEVAAKLDVITKNVDLASSVVRNLLDFSRQTQLNMFPINLEDVLGDSLEMLSPRLNDIQVENKVKDLPNILGDPKQLQQVFANVIINAVQAMPKGGKISIKSGLEGRFVALFFSDTGKGIADDQLAKIFDPFFTTKEVGAGTGLGLSLTYGIVKAHGGDIVVESVEGKGTTVIIKLPVS